MAGDWPIPFLCVYSGSKSFLKRTTCVLHEDERALHDSNLSFIHLNIAEVRSSTLTGTSSFFKPLADEFAECMVRSLGCGRQVVVPWYSHAILTGIMSLLPEPVSKYFASVKSRGAMKDVSRPKDR